MKIVIIGSGNLATQLALALKDANQEIVQIFSRTSAHAKELADKIGCAYTASLEAVQKDADIYILAVKDDALAALAANLCAARTDALFLHTAGSMPMDVFKGHALQYGVLYPMQTFSKNRRVNFREIPCFIEASSPSALATIRTLAESISDHVVDCDSEKRKKMHLAAVLACNLTNHCYRLAERVLEAEQKRKPPVRYEPSPRKTPRRVRWCVTTRTSCRCRWQCCPTTAPVRSTASWQRASTTMPLPYNQ